MWNFYDAFAGGRVGHKESQGPMPRKRWVRDGKKHRLHYKAPRQIARGPLPSDRDMERKAAEYAGWLARRDGKTLPDGRVCVHWSGVSVLRPDGRGKWEKRICAVSFGDTEIELPNWDFIADPANREANAEAARRRAA